MIMGALISLEKGEVSRTRRERGKDGVPGSLENRVGDRRGSDVLVAKGFETEGGRNGRGKLTIA